MDKKSVVLGVGILQVGDILSSLLVLSRGSFVKAFEANLLYSVFPIPIEASFPLSALLGVSVAYVLWDQYPFFAEVQLFILPFIVLGNVVFAGVVYGVLPSFLASATTLMSAGALTFYLVVVIHTLTGSQQVAGSTAFGIHNEPEHPDLEKRRH